MREFMRKLNIEFDWDDNFFLLCSFIVSIMVQVKVCAFTISKKEKNLNEIWIKYRRSEIIFFFV
jgi:hypothetical protein